MKACLIFQRRFTPVAHEIALELERNHGVSEFCGYVFIRSGLDFLRKQSDISYGTLLLDEDLHEQAKKEEINWDYLDRAEKEYGLPFLWPYISIDRIIRYGMAVREFPYDTPPFTHEEMVKILQVKIKAITEFLEKEKPDFIYLPAVSAMGNMLIYFIGKKMGIKVLVGAEVRIGQRYALSESYKNFSWAEEKFRALEESKSKSALFAEAKKYLEGFRNKPSTYLYVMGEFKKAGSWQKILTWFYPRNIYASIRWYLKLTWKTFTAKRKDYTDESPLAFFVDKIRRKLRLLRGYRDLYDKVDGNDVFAYYPLHLEPEIAILLLAPHWTDQINLIKQIAQSLPLKYKLYVKEHPAMVGFRPRSQYKELKKIPNVKLIEPNTDSYSLIKKSSLITTISGTAGWEGLMMKKPVITFGDVYFNAVSMVKKCRVIDELPNLIKSQLESFKFNEDELINFIAALTEDSVDIKLHEIWEKGVAPEVAQKNISIFCNLLIEKAGLKK